MTVVLAIFLTVSPWVIVFETYEGRNAMPDCVKQGQLITSGKERRPTNFKRAHCELVP